ncbi:PAS domain S-box protein [Pseudoduganella lutea]|uniref:histidine kinase n=2 Tax=Pseudoduganella lutea TaxID=321985 RepID=A0A4P6L5K6_9BURK|nr:PAS domain S-box protein [Pseudoduganella lutea]
MLEAREELRRARAWSGEVLDSIADGLAIVDEAWTITWINARAAGLLGHEGTDHDSAAGLAGRGLWQAFPALAGSALEARLRQAMADRTATSFELFHAPGQRWLEVRTRPSAQGLTCMLLDIDARKRDERALRENSNRLQVAMAAGRLGEWTWDAATDVVTLGRRAAEIFDLPEGTPIAWHALQERIAPEDRAAARQVFVDAYIAHRDFDIECRIQARGGDGGEGGERRWLSVVGHGNYDDGDRLLGMTGMVQDISARRAAEEALKDSEAQLRALADSIPQLAWIAHHDGRMTWYNRRWFEYTGLTSDDLRGEGWGQVYDPECIPAMTQHWKNAIDSGQPFEMEFPIRGADGQYRWFLTRANPVRDGEGRTLRWFGTSTDVDQVKRAQEALRDETAVLELLNSTGNALSRHRDLQPLLQEVTDAATRISGARFGAFFYDKNRESARDDAHAPAPAGDPGQHSGDDVMTPYTLAGRPPSPFGELARTHAAALFGDTLRGSTITRCSDLLRQPGCAPALPAGHVGALRSYLAAPVMSRDGSVIGTLLFGHPEPGMFSERTERIIGGIAAQAGVAIDNARLNEAARRAAEERIALLDSERNARAEAERTSQMKDEFLATLSHELRTPLTAILGWSQILRRGGRGEADMEKGLQTIERNARAQAQLIEDLLDMSRIMSGKVLLDIEAVAPATVIDAAIETVRPAAAARHIRIERDFGPCGMVAADAGRLQQVVWNLLSNAIKFTPQDGSVRVSVREAGGQAEIVVADTGIGIGGGFLAHVFEHFRQADASSTRRHGGLGLGLSIVKHLVEQHGGTVVADSAGEGRGATFTVRLPLAARVPGAERPPRPALPDGEPRMAVADDLRDLGGLRVLIVDDEPDTRDLIKRVLSDCNAEVVTADSAPAALSLLPRWQPDLLLSDIGMPEMDGFELLAQVRALGPEAGGNVPAIALTAFARAEDRLRTLAAGFSDHIAKPVEAPELVAAVALAAARRRVHPG